MTVNLDLVRIHDAMHPGILSCAADAPLGEVAGIMAKDRVHAVAITDEESARPAGVVSDLDVVASISRGEEPSAAQTAATEPLSVSADERLERAAQLMAEHGVSLAVILRADGTVIVAPSPRVVVSRARGRHAIEQSE